MSIVSFSNDNLLSSDGKNLLNTPVILNSTFFVKSPFSYPKILSSAITSSPKLIWFEMPVQFRNWLTVLSA